MNLTVRLQHSNRYLVIAWLGFVFVSLAAAQEDFSAELPRIPPTEPADTLESFTVAPGFRMGTRRRRTFGCQSRRNRVGCDRPSVRLRDAWVQRRPRRGHLANHSTGG